MTRVIALSVAVLLAVPITSVVRVETSLRAAGQEPSAPVVFEVAAVRLNKSGQIAAQFDDLPRPVIDQTGLTGAWEFQLMFVPPQQRLPGQEPVLTDPNAPSLMTALQEQLGLKLDSIQSPMEFLIVDRVERLDRQDAIDPDPD